MMNLPPLWSPEVEARVVSEARNLDAQTVPAEVKFCKRCVVSNQRPRIVFDDEGICSACRFAEVKAATDWAARGDELEALLYKHRRNSGNDVIVPCSGGKDSAMVAHRLKHEHGMKPLGVKWAPFAYTDIGFDNFNSFVQSGFDVQVGWPNGHIHRKLARLSFEFLGDPWQPFAFGQLMYPLHMALKFGVPLVMFGENGEAEYGGDPAANDKPCWSFDDWERVYLKGAGVQSLINIGVGLGAINDDEAASVTDFYQLPSLDAIRKARVEFHWFGYYHKWLPQENYYYASEHTGFQANTHRTEGTYSKYASIDDRLDGLHYYTAYMKFGIGRCTSDAAHEIRDRHLTREEGVALVHKFDGEFPAKHQAFALGYLGMTPDSFAATCDRYRPAHLWVKIGDNWQLRERVT